MLPKKTKYPSIQHAISINLWHFGVPGPRSAPSLAGGRWESPLPAVSCTRPPLLPGGRFTTQLIHRRYMSVSLCALICVIYIDIWQLIHLYKIGVLFPNNPTPKPWPILEWMVIYNINHKPQGVFHAAAQISWKLLMAKLRVPTQEIQELLFHLGKDISDNPILAINLHAWGRCDVSHCPRILSLKQKGIGFLSSK